MTLTPAIAAARASCAADASGSLPASGGGSDVGSGDGNTEGVDVGRRRPGSCTTTSGRSAATSQPIDRRSTLR